jgi:nucleotide sugar dehydrogenase
MNLLTANLKDLSKAIEERSLRACVVGVGYVGLPLCVILGEKGFKVTGVDKNSDVIEKCKKGQVHLHEEGLSQRLLKLIEQEMVSFSTDVTGVVRRSDVIFITVGTPLAVDANIDTTGVERAAMAVGKGLSKGKLVILKSTISIGGVRKIAKPILEEASGLVAERDFGLAFVPERTVEGRALEELPELPKIVAGLGERSRRAAQDIFYLIGGPIVPVSCLEVAEAAKLFDNVYRDVNIALANELAIFCEHVGVDVIEAIKATNHDYPRTHLLIPGIGVGGSCLTKDSYIFAQSCGGKNGATSLIYQARQLNDSMPQHFIELVKDAFHEMQKSISGSHVAVLGYAMKGETDDTRNTPVRKLVDWLSEQNAEISLYDPFVSPRVIQKELGIRGVNSLADAVCAADMICLATNHKEFSNLDLALLRSDCHEPCAIVDGRHVVDPQDALSHGFIFRGVGRPHGSFMENPL